MLKERQHGRQQMTIDDFAAEHVDLIASIRNWDCEASLSLCARLLLCPQIHAGVSYRGRENSYTPPSHNGTGVDVDSGRGPARAWGLVRLRVRARDVTQKGKVVIDCSGIVRS